MRGDNISTVGVTSVLWRVFSTVGDNISTVGDTFSTVGDNISTVEVAQYSGDKDLNITNFQRISKSFPELISLRNQIDHITGLNCQTMADMVKDLGYKNLVLGKILL